MPQATLGMPDDRERRARNPSPCRPRPRRYKHPAHAQRHPAHPTGPDYRSTAIAPARDTEPARRRRPARLHQSVHTLGPPSSAAPRYRQGAHSSSSYQQPALLFVSTSFRLALSCPGLAWFCLSCGFPRPYETTWHAQNAQFYCARQDRVKLRSSDVRVPVEGRSCRCAYCFPSAHAHRQPARPETPDEPPA